MNEPQFEDNVGMEVSDPPSKTCTTEQPTRQQSYAPSRRQSLTNGSFVIRDSNGAGSGLSQATVILGMERTLFAALNNAWLIAIGGIGLMSVGDGDRRALHAGIAVLGSSISCAVLAAGLYFYRVYQLTNNRRFSYIHTVIWVSVVGFLTLFTLSLELYFGILNPYLEREKAVKILSDNDTI